MENEAGKSDEKVNKWLAEHLAGQTRIKLLGRLAVGAMLITAAAFIYQGLSEGKAPSLSPGEKTEVWAEFQLPDTPYYADPDYRDSQLGIR